MSDLTQVNTNLSALNEKQEKANEIAQGNVSANNENNSVLIGLGQTIESGEKKAASAISERLGGLKDGIVGLFAGNNGGNTGQDATIDFVIFPSTGNAADFGDLSETRGGPGNGGCGSSTRAVSYTHLTLPTIYSV